MRCPKNNDVVFDYADCQDCEHCASCYIQARAESVVGDNFPTLKVPFELNDYKRKNPHKITDEELNDFKLDLYKLHSFSEWEEKCRI